MDYDELLSNISFHFVDPNATPSANGLFALPKGDGSWAWLLPLPEAPFDVANTRLPRDEREMPIRLRDICRIPRMSTFAIGAMINWGVSRMPDDQVFVNVGVWNGFTLLAGMIGNSNKACIGVDNFSQFGGPRDDFHARFERYRSLRHRFYDMDYSEYFSAFHKGPIGVYIYDGDHTYENQLRGLQLAEPFFVEGCLIFVDDTNWPEPRQATLSFIDQNPHEYRIVFDAGTSGNGHPTFWNGVMVLEKTGSARDPARRRNGRRTGVVASQGAYGHISDGQGPAHTVGCQEWSGRERPMVSLIVNASGWGDKLEESIQCALRQTYRDTEVIVVHSPSEQAKRDMERFAGRIIAVESKDAGQSPAFRVGLRASRGELVCMLSAEDTLPRNAIEAAIGVWEQDAAFERQVRESMRQLETIVPVGEAFILVDEERWGLGERLVGRRQIPFLERGGHYWGKPPDDETAIREVERLRQAGARFMAFGWPAFWWLDYYRALHAYLCSHFACLLENERLVVFDLRQ